MPVDLPERRPPDTERSDPTGLEPGLAGLVGAPALSGATMAKLRHRWGWFVALGVLAMLFGAAALAMVVHATITTVYLIATFMIIAGGSEIVIGVGSRTWGRAFLLVVAGLFYVFAGAFALAQPIHAAVIFTLMLGAAMLVAGAIRVYIGTHMHSHARTMVVVGGLVTALVGLLIVLGWPTNSVVILGTLLGVDLLFTGLMWIGLGIRLRGHA